MKLSKEQITKLQNLSAIKLSGEEELVFFDKLASVIDFLSKLKELDLSSVDLDEIDVDQKMLKTIDEVSDFADKKLLLDNVEHEMINNSVVVKSVLN